jgi:Family of unknown function (DUF6049)
MSRLLTRAPLRVPARNLVLLVALALLTLGSLLAPTGVRAQESGSDGLSLELVDQPVSYGADGKLAIEVRVTNDSSEELPGFIVNVGREARLTSRSDLQNSFDAPPGVTPWTTPPRVVSQPLAPNESRVIKLNQAVSTLFSAVDEEGIYTAHVFLLDSSGGTVLDSLTTHLMFYPDETESQLNFVTAVPLNEVPARGPDGDFVTESSAGRPSLEESLSNRGWLARTVRELNDLGGSLRLGIAPTPRLVEEIADMSDGYRRGDAQVTAAAPEAEAAADLIEQLGQLLRTDGIQPLLVPYANPDLPSLAASGVDDHLGTQITLGETILSDTLDVDVDRSWIFPGGRANADSLELLRLTSNAGERTFFTEATLEAPPDPLLAGCPIEALSPACPVSVSTQAGETLGYQADPGLQDRLAALVRGDEDRLNLQRFFAETAMIRQEQPGRTDRVVQATLPSLWHPRPEIIRTLYRGLARAPWLNTVTPDEGLALDIDPVGRRLSDDAGSLQNELDPLDYSAIAQAESTIESFNSVGPPPGLYQRLLRNYLVAESRNWWIDDEAAARGLAYATAAADEARTEMDKVSIEVSERITLTSRAEDIPVRILNNASYPVKVRFRMDSTRLRVEDEDVQTFETGRTPMTIPVRADSSGFFPVTMALVTPDGSEVIAESEPTVRSTEFNNVALTITVGALFFLIAFYLLRWYRKRNAPAAREPA